MAEQYARGLWGRFAPDESPFEAPNGMEDNIRWLDDHLGLYTLQPPVDPSAPEPEGPNPGDGQIFTDGTYSVFNGGEWRSYPPRKGLRAVLATGTENWLNTGASWEYFSVIDTGPALAGAQAAEAGALAAADTAAALTRRRATKELAIADATIPEGEYFSTPSPVEGEAAIIWRKGSGTAVESTRVPSSATVLQMKGTVDAVGAVFETVSLVINQKAPTGGWLVSNGFGAWAFLLKPGIDVPVGAKLYDVTIPLVQVAASATHIRYRLATRASNNAEGTSPSIGSPDVLIETQTLPLAQVGLTAAADPKTMDLQLAAPYTAQNGQWIVFDWEALDVDGVRVASGCGFRSSGSDTTGQRGWYRNSLTANWGSLNNAFSLCWGVSGRTLVLKEAALPVSDPPAPAMLTRDAIESVQLSVSGQAVSASVTFVRSGIRTTYIGSVNVPATSTVAVTSAAPEARTLSNPLSGTLPAFAYVPTGGQLAYANVSAFVARRASDSVLLNENTDYLLNAEHGGIVRATSGADVAVSVTYNAAQTRYSLLYIDAETGAIGLIGGSQKVRGAAEFMPVPSSSSQIPLGAVRAVGTSVTVQPIWKVDRGFIHADLAEQWSRDIARNKACLRSTLAALRRGQDVDVISYGDSILAMQNSSPSANVANTAARDRATSTNGYLLSPANIIDASLIAAIPTYDTGDGAGQVHTRFGFAWDMVQAMRAAYGGAVNVYNLGIGGTNSGNTSNGGTETNHLAALTTLIAASVAAGRRVLVLLNYGMNEIGNTSTEARMISILAAIFAAGGSSRLADSILASPARRNLIDVGYTDDQWRLTSRALRRAAEYVDPTTGKSAAFIDMQALFDDAFNVLGLHRLDNSGANLTNHPGIREHRAMGLAASAWID